MSRIEVFCYVRLHIYEYFSKAFIPSRSYKSHKLYNISSWLDKVVLNQKFSNSWEKLFSILLSTFQITKMSLYIIFNSFFFFSFSFQSYFLHLQIIQLLYVNFVKKKVLGLASSILIWANHIFCPFLLITHISFCHCKCK